VVVPASQQIRDVLGLIADFASLVGVIVSIGVAISVRRLRAYYVFRKRVPDLVARIAQKSSRASDLAADFGNTRDDIIVEIRQIAVFAESIAAKSSGAAKVPAKQLARRLKQTRLLTRTEFSDVYADIQSLIARCEEIQRDQEWEGR
jgi:hypothetical protein